MNISEMNVDQLNEVVKQGQLASQEIANRHMVSAQAVEERIKSINQGKFESRFSDAELTYAAVARCECGAGYAYPKNSSIHGRWICSSILKAEDKALPPTRHSAELPFAFYDVKSEGQPSADRKSTRPQNV